MTSTDQRSIPLRERASWNERYRATADFFDAFAPVERRWRRRNRKYHDLILSIYRSLVPSGRTVLEIGSGGGDLLAALEPARGLGVDVSPAMVELARSRYPDLEFHVAAGERFRADETFDYVVLSDLLPFVQDLLGLFKNVARHARPETRIVLHFYNQLWRPLIRLAEVARLKPRKPLENWISPSDVLHLLGLAGLDVITVTRRILFPKRFPVVAFLLNAFVAAVWPFNRLCLTHWVVARPKPVPRAVTGVSVICPCKDEAGTIARIVAELPPIGAATELVFVEGGSTDATRTEIRRQIELNPERDIRLVDQSGSGKGDAVRAGFAVAKHDVLMILDADLAVDPAELTQFYDALIDRHGELVNGSRLVYGVEAGAMRTLNMLGNKLFSAIFTSLLQQPVKDTLCGTKALSRDDYGRIAESRPYFGNFDPFGDFDLLLGAARLNLKIVDLPVRYRRRMYGDTKISRFRHGWLLIKMSVFAFWKLRAAPLRG